jgi:hypothetical protein
MANLHRPAAPPPTSALLCADQLRSMLWLVPEHKVDVFGPQDLSLLEMQVPARRQAENGIIPCIRHKIARKGEVIMQAKANSDMSST